MTTLLPVPEPGQGIAATRRPVAPLPARGGGLTVGLVDNSKAGAAVIVEELTGRLAGGGELTRVPVRKVHASLPMAADDLDRLRGAALVISALGDCGSCTSWTVRDAVALESAGVAAIVACTRPFESFARSLATTLGVPDLRLVVLEHPIAELTDEQVRARVARVTGDFDRLWAERPAGAGVAAPAGGARSGPVRLERVELAGADPGEELMDLLAARGLSDGLPVVPASPDRVERMLDGYDGDPDEPFARMPPGHGVVTARAVGVVAVMAGCLPGCFPVVMAAVRAVLADEFNLNGVQTTTHPCGVFTLVSGPVTTRIGMNCGGNAFGPGNRANATIGRAVRLAQLAIGGARPGAGDMATLGSPAKYTFAAAENHAASPWGTLAQAQGFSPQDSVVTVVGAEAPQNVNDHESKTAVGLLRMIAGTMRTPGANNSYYRDGQVVVVLSPEHAATLAGEGYTREDVQAYLWAEARTPIGYFSQGNIDQRLRTRFPKEFGEHGPHTLVPIVHDPANILLTVVGGPGKHSMFIPTFGGTRAVSVRVGGG